MLDTAYVLKEKNSKNKTYSVDLRVAEPPSVS